MRRVSSLFLIVSGLWGVAGCNGAAQVDDPPVPTAETLEPTELPESVRNVPEQFDVKFETTAGEFVVRFTRDWAPYGVARVYELIKSGFYDDAGFFRVVPGFVVQFGISGDPEVQQKWRDANIPDDPVLKSNERGYVTFATSGPNSRSTQLFISLSDNPNLDEMGFAPIGVVVDGMNVVESITSEYGEQPRQDRIQYEGNEYLRQEFPNLDYIQRATIIHEEQ